MWDIQTQNPLQGSVELLADGMEAGSHIESCDTISVSSKRSKVSHRGSQMDVSSIVKSLTDSVHAKSPEIAKEVCKQVQIVMNEDAKEEVKKNGVAQYDVGELFNLIQQFEKLIDHKKAQIRDNICDDEMETNNRIRILTCKLEKLYEKMEMTEE